jgi:hypothetical protein
MVVVSLKPIVFGTYDLGGFCSYQAAAPDYYGRNFFHQDLLHFAHRLQILF